MAQVFVLYLEFFLFAALIMKLLISVSLNGVFFQ